MRYLILLGVVLLLAGKLGPEAPSLSTSAVPPFWTVRPAGDRQANPIDVFIASRLNQRANQSPTRAELLRRVTLDLTGLPPTSAEVEAFLKDDRPDAYEKAIDRLLASPAYGERWAKHWLELARYADPGDPKTTPEMWRYRDWVIEMFNGPVKTPGPKPEK